MKKERKKRDPKRGKKQKITKNGRNDRPETETKKEMKTK